MESTIGVQEQRHIALLEGASSTASFFVKMLKFYKTILYLKVVTGYTIDEIKIYCMFCFTMQSM